MLAPPQPTNKTAAPQENDGEFKLSEEEERELAELMDD
jgi:hypothetical protein